VPVAIAQSAPKKIAKKLARATATKTPWAINVASFSSKKFASELAGGLNSAGFNSYITEFTKDGKKWYRVRAGFFKTRDEAVIIGGKIKSRFNVGSAWIVQPSTVEIEEHSAR
jgi:cell division septation protein DedD